MATFGSWSPPRSQAHTALAVCIILMTAGAWGALWVLDGASQGFSHYHHHAHVSHAGSLGLAAWLFIGGWILMTVAMMLPTSLPVLTVFSTIAGQRADRTLLLALVVTGYLLVWSLFGGAVYLGNLVLLWLASASSWLVEHSWAVSPALLLIAGIFQFTPLKYRCLDKCRSPLSFVLGHWHGRHERRQAFRLGVDHGIFCVGCCWALMLLMFIVGVGSLLWMLILAIVMGVEKNAPWGRRLSAPLGIVLLLSAVALTLPHLFLTDDRSVREEAWVCAACPLDFIARPKRPFISQFAFSSLAYPIQNFLFSMREMPGQPVLEKDRRQVYVQIPRRFYPVLMNLNLQRWDQSQTAGRIGKGSAPPGSGA